MDDQPGATRRMGSQPPRGAIETHGFILSEAEARRVHRLLAALVERLSCGQGAWITLVLRDQPTRRRVSADLSVELARASTRLVSHREARLARTAARRAVGDLERLLARQPGRRCPPASTG
jgi:hypothetical protein